MKKILVYGYGNPGRQDDGLGVLLAEKIGDWAKKNNYARIHTDTNYQLNIEDAYELNNYNAVIFADASVEEIDTFLFEPLKPDFKTNFSMHSVSPAFILGLCQEMYKDFPDTFLLHIKGFEWEFMEEISEKAVKNLDLALEFLTAFLESLLKKNS
ncbi:MAG: hydrogenase maturation protease [Bacteroidales bacterium]|nr:hydrogenase maturation protease [Bacteroidales bacterium]MBN2818990.1 hydrogenase maturation protease [Bacteroidales bacterium]